MDNKRINSSLATLVAFSFLGVSCVGADNDVEQLEQIAQIDNSGVAALKGVTVGIDAVYSHSDVKNEESYAHITLSNGSTGKVSTVNTKLRRCSIDPSINVGYSYFNNNWYVGIAGEISFGRNRRKYVRTSKTISAEAETVGFSSKIKAKGGYYFSDLNSAIYLLAGLKWRNSEIQYRAINELNNEVSVGSKAKLSHPLYVVGVGVETPIYEKLSVSAEYEYAWRNSNDVSKLKNANSTMKFGLKQSLREHNFKLGIKYHV